jgi:hypothetical protein
MPFISVQALDEPEVHCPTCQANPDEACVPTPNDPEYGLISDANSFHLARTSLCSTQVPVHAEP